MQPRYAVHFTSRPTMLVAWPGPGNVGFLAVDYIRTQLKAHAYAQIDMSALVIPDTMVVSEGVARFTDMPDSIFHYHYNPDLILFESTAQVGGREAAQIIQAVLDMARQFNVCAVYSASAFIQPNSAINTTHIYCACNSERMVPPLQSSGAEPVLTGRLTGIDGMLLSMAKSQDIETACVLSAIPLYAERITYPKGAAALITTISKLLKVTLDMSDINEAVDAMDVVLEDLEEKLGETDTQPTAQAPTEAPPPLEPSRINQVPVTIHERIEQLFAEVEHDRSRAGELKAFLDRWGVFDKYEDRFLDMFSDGDDLEHFLR